MSQARRLKDAFRYLKMDGNVAAAARRSGTSEHQIRRLVSSDEAWSSAQDAGLRRKAEEAKRDRARAFETVKGAARARRLAADQYRKEFYAKLPAMSRSEVAQAIKKTEALEVAALEAERVYFKFRHEEEKWRNSSTHKT